MYKLYSYKESIVKFKESIVKKSIVNGVAQASLFALTILLLSSCAVLTTPLADSDWTAKSVGDFTFSTRTEGEIGGLNETMIQYYYRIDSGNFNGRFENIHVEFYWPANGRVMRDNFTFSEADLGRTFKGSRWSWEEDWGGRARFDDPGIKWRISSSPYKATVRNDSGHLLSGIFKESHFVEGLINTNDGRVYFVNWRYSENGFNGHQTEVRKNGTTLITPVKNGEPDGWGAIVDKNGSVSPARWENGTNVIESHLASQAERTVAAQERKELKKLDSEHRKVIKKTQDQVELAQREASSLTTPYAKFFSGSSGKDACSCAFKGCLWSFGADTSYDERQAAMEKDKAEKEVCRALRRAGIRTDTGLSLNEILRGANISSAESAGADLAQAQQKLKEAVRKQEEVVRLEEEQAAQRAALAVRLEQERTERKQQAIAKDRANRKVVADRLAREHQEFLQCCAEHGLKGDPKTWTVYPEDCS